MSPEFITLVPRAAKDDKVSLIRATSLQETLQGTANFVGPLAAGLMIGIFSESVALVAVSLVFLVCIFLIRGVRPQTIVHSERLTIKKALTDIREGFSFVFKEPLLGPITLLLAIVVCFVPALKLFDAKPADEDNSTPSESAK